MSEYIINTDRAEELSGDSYKEYFEQSMLTFMGNPAIEEIVRCRDCKYSKKVNTYKPEYDWWKCDHPELYDDKDGDGQVYLDIKPDGFCAWGERK